MLSIYCGIVRSGNVVNFVGGCFGGVSGVRVNGGSF